MATKKEDVATELATQAQNSISEFMVENPKEVVDKMLASGGELATQFVKLEDNSGPLHGIFTAYGLPHEFQSIDPKTGEVTVREAKTIVVKSMSGKASVRLIANYELIQKMADVPFGSEVMIFRGGRKTIQSQSGPRQVSEFQVVVKRAKSAISDQTKALP
jgi:hypothetical protein